MSQSNRSIGGKQSGGKSGTNRNTPNRAPNQNQRRDSVKKSNNNRSISAPIEHDLINSSSELVVRWSANELLAKRLQYTDAPVDWTPNNRCTWRDEKSRLERIHNDDTLFNDYSPLEINEETRWKSKAMLKTPSPTSADSEAIVIAKLQSILNKLSWTNLDKLTVQFLGSLGSTVEQHMIQTSLRLVARKASLEPHFGPLYARLSVKLALTHKAFKKTLLSICKELFDQLTEKGGDVDKKELIGLTKFVGELYVQKLIRGPIMVGCCEVLLQSETDDAKLEAASQVLTIVGQDLDTEKPEGVDALWDHVTSLSGAGSKVSKRIQFLLQAVLEVRANKWVNIRHQQESAMTIAQVHAQAAADAKKGPVVSTSALRRSRSSEGFGRKRQKSPVATPSATARRSPLRRVRSEAPTKSTLQSSLQSSLQRAAMGTSSEGHATTIKAESTSSLPPPPDPDQAAKQFVSALRDFFVHGDVKEIVLSVKEISLDDEACCAAAISSGILFVLEKKETDVAKFLEAVDHCVREGRFSGEMLADGLVEPFDLLRDIEIDAPLAPKFLATIVAHWLKSHATLEGIVQKCSTTFKEDGRPEELFATVLRLRGDKINQETLRVFKSLCSSDADALKYLEGLPLQIE